MNGNQPVKTIYFTVENCFFSQTNAKASNQDAVIYLNPHSSYQSILFKITGNEIDLSKASDLPFFYTMLSYLEITELKDNYISPYERGRLLGNLRMNKWDFESNTHEYPKQVIPDYKYENHPENEKVEEKIEHTGSAEKTTLVKITESSFKDFKSEGDGGLMKFKDIEVQCENTKISGCEANNGAGGGLYVENRNDLNGKVNIKDVQFINCKADYGGGLYIYSDSTATDVKVESCVFKGNTAKKTSGSKYGGSAVYCSVTKGEILDCEFIDNHGGSQIKVTDPSKESLKLLNSIDSLLFFNCNFVASKESRESIYYDGAKILSIVKCNFNGKLAKGANYIDGQPKSKPSIRIEDCKFEYNRINKKLVISADSNSKRFNLSKTLSMVLIAVGAVTLVALVGLVLKLRKSRVEDNDDDEDSNEKQIINESL